MKTYLANATDRQRDWYVVDAEGKTLGRLATQIADALRGKRKPTYTPHVDVGDFVVVVDAEKIQVTGDKRERSATGATAATPAGSARGRWRDARSPPEEVIRSAVKGMLPRNLPARKQLIKLKVYAGPGAPARGPAAETDGDQLIDGRRREDSRARATRRPRARTHRPRVLSRRRSSSSSQAAGEEPTSTPPAEEASDAPAEPARGVSPPRSP